MVLNKFINELAKNNKKKQDLITVEVNNFFKTEKITEKNLKDLKSRVHALVNGKGLSIAGSQKGEEDK